MFMDVMNASDPLQIQLASLPQANLSPRSTTKSVTHAQGKLGPLEPQAQLSAQAGSEAWGLRQVTLRMEVDTF